MSSVKQETLAGNHLHFTLFAAPSGEQIPTVPPDTLQTLEAATSFIRTSAPSQIAAQLILDNAIVEASRPGLLPSLLAHALPRTDTLPKNPHPPEHHLANCAIPEISTALYQWNWGRPVTEYPRVPNYLEIHGAVYGSPSFKSLRYTEMIKKIRHYLATGVNDWSDTRAADNGADTEADSGGAGPEVAATGGLTEHLKPTESDYAAALKVLTYLQRSPPWKFGRHLNAAVLRAETPLVQVLQAVEYEMNSAPHALPRGKTLCYICSFKLTSHHPIYPALCRPCGEFNVSACNETLPGALSLHGRTAVVTGARVNLGYYTVLRLLRCGARVMATTRYPLDAQERYLAEPDMTEWKDRLKIVGADFRAAKDAFGLVGVVKRWLAEEVGTEKLDILINNAAQTLTDKFEMEAGMVGKEEELDKIRGSDSDPKRPTFVVKSKAYTYRPRLRGGFKTLELEGPSGSTRLVELHPDDADDETPTTTTTDDTISLPAPPPWKSSWAQTLPEVPYIDILTAHSINAFVPLILSRELLPSLSHPRPPSTTSPPTTAPRAYIINISSRESLRELRPAHAAKAGHHVHTNMSKAALNMLTHTEAGPAWRGGRVAVNSVDPGYMSADKEWLAMLARGKGGGEGGGQGEGGGEGEGREIQECPLGWEDGVGRVLWVVARGEGGEPVWGRFLKHFTAVRAGG